MPKVIKNSGCLCPGEIEDLELKEKEQYFQYFELKNIPFIWLSMVYRNPSIMI